MNYISYVSTSIFTCILTMVSNVKIFDGYFSSSACLFSTLLLQIYQNFAFLYDFHWSYVKKFIIFFPKLIFLIERSLKGLQNFSSNIYLCIHYAYFLSLNDNIVDIEKHDGIVLLYMDYIQQFFLSKIPDLHK